MKVLYYILDILDYLYYRAFHWYGKHKDSKPGIMAASIVTVLLFLSLFVIVISLSIVLSITIPAIPKWIIAILYLAILVLIMYRYSKITISTLDIRWKKENLNKKRRRGWIILIVLVGELLFIIVSSYIRQNIYGNATFL